MNLSKVPESELLSELMRRAIERESGPALFGDIPPPRMNSLRDHELAEEFMAFWSDYPKKVGKGNAFRSYCKARRSGVTKDRILGGLRSQLKSLEARDKKYRPNPSTWLNGGRWEDDASDLVEEQSFDHVADIRRTVEEMERRRQEAKELRERIERERIENEQGV